MKRKPTYNDCIYILTSLRPLESSCNNTVCCCPTGGATLTNAAATDVATNITQDEKHQRLWPQLGAPIVIVEVKGHLLLIILRGLNEFEIGE